jgi:hypothetical protein
MRRDHNSTANSTTRQSSHDEDRWARLQLPEWTQRAVLYDLPSNMACITLLEKYEEWNDEQLFKERVLRSRRTLAIQAYGPDYPVEIIK